MKIAAWLTLALALIGGAWAISDYKDNTEMAIHTGNLETAKYYDGLARQGVFLLILSAGMVIA